VNEAFEWSVVLSHLGHIAIAYVLSVPIGWEREKAGRTAGLRTFPLLAIATCGYVLIANDVFSVHPEAKARMIEGVIAGMGFIGGGSILKQNGRVEGITTAVSLWNTGAIGAAVALSRYEIAVILSVMNLATLRLLLPLKREIEADAPVPSDAKHR
jgi:putative Mg2+ transporter-C (MgtC) family protein